jgi:hypothetical protein
MHASESSNERVEIEQIIDFRSVVGAVEDDSLPKRYLHQVVRQFLVQVESVEAERGTELTYCGVWKAGWCAS